MNNQMKVLQAYAKHAQEVVKLERKILEIKNSEDRLMLALMRMLKLARKEKFDHIDSVNEAEDAIKHVHQRRLDHD